MSRSKVWIAVAALAGIGAARGPASAEDRAAVLDAPAPPTLPALAHPSLTYTFELTAAGIEPAPAPAGETSVCFWTTLSPRSCEANAIHTPPASAAEYSYAWFAHNELELPLQSRKWYLGAAHDIAAGAVPGVGHDVFFGNPEIWGRGLWSSVRGLSSGGGFGLVLPVPRDPSETTQRVLGTVRVVRPWDAAYFNDRILTLRPWFDMRHVTGPLIVQLRQGLDVAFTLRELKMGERRIDLTARATLYVGYRATEAIGLGLEVWEVYPLTANITDDKRASVAISPSIRFLLGRVAPALSVLLPVTTPLRGEAASYYAARLNVSFTFNAGKSGRDQAPDGASSAGP